MRLHYSNTAPVTTLTADVSNSVTTLPVVATAGFPTLPFKIAINHGDAAEEICLVTAVTSTSMTVTRGYDNTSAVSHSSNDPIEHVVTAGDYDAMNVHIEDTTRDDHTQYLTTSRHAATDHSALLLDVVSVIGAAGASRTLSFDTASVWDLTLDQNVAITIAAPPAAGFSRPMTILIREGATPRTVTWVDTIHWPDGGGFPALAANSVNIVQVFTVDGGTTYYGSVWSNVLTDVSGFLTVSDAIAAYMPLAGGVFTAAVDHGTVASPNDLRYATLDRISGKVATIATSGSVALQRGRTHEMSGNASGALTFSYAAAGSGGPVAGLDCTSAIVIKMGASVQTVNWMAGIKWIGGVPTFQANTWTLVHLISLDGGTTTIGSVGRAS